MAPKSFFVRLRQNDFLVSSSIIFAGSFVVNVLNYIFTVIISRILGVIDFGEVTALFSLLLIVSVPATALTMLMTREAAFYSAKNTGSLQELFILLRKNVFVASLVLWGIFLGFTPLLAGFLKISYLPIFIFSLLIPITLATSLQSGTLQGLQEFFLLSKQNILNALIKLVISFALVYAGYSVVGVMVGLLLAQLAAWGYGYLATRSIFAAGMAESVSSQPFSTTSLRTLFTPIFLTTLLLVLLSNIDVLMAKHFLPADLAGHYGALSTLGKLLIYGIGAFITVLLPMVSAAEAHEGGGSGRSILGFSLFIIAAASVCVYILFTLFPTFIITLLFGARYMGVAPYLPLFSVAMGAISLSTALINYFIAVRNSSFMYFLGMGIMLEVALIVLNHTSIGAITDMLAISSIALLVLMGVNYALLPNKISQNAQKTDMHSNTAL